MAYVQTTLTDIRQKFLHAISTNNCCAGRSGNCRLATTVCCEFISLWSKSEFARAAISESSKWSLAQPNAKFNLACWMLPLHWDEMKFNDSNECSVKLSKDTYLSWYYTANVIIFIFGCSNGWKQELQIQSPELELKIRSDQSLQMPNFFRESTTSSQTV